MDYPTKCIPETAGLARLDETLLAKLVQASPAVLYSCKVSGDYGTIAVTENARALLGYAPEDFIADPGFWAVRIHPEDSARVFAEMPRLFREGVQTIEYRFRIADGSYLWLRDQMTLEAAQDGSPPRILGSWLAINPPPETTFVAQILHQVTDTKTTNIAGGDNYAYQT